MNLEEMIESEKKAVEEGKATLLKCFAFVPDDKVGWSPSGTARTPIWIVAHCGAANQAFATILRGEPLDMPSDPAEASKAIRYAGRDVASREEAVRMVEESSAATLAALDAVTPEMFATSPDSPFGPIPFAFWMTVPGRHMMGHAQQVAYIQTIWGDLKDHAM